MAPKKGEADKYRASCPPNKRPAGLTRRVVNFAAAALPTANKSPGRTFVRYAVTVALLALLAGAPASADYDPAEEAREKAQRDAAQRAEQQKQQEMQRQKRDAEAKYNAAVSAETMKSRRKALGAAADGKSDAEVNRLYDAKLKTDDDTVKSLTGKSMKDMEKMSNAELEALSRELEKKYK